MQIAELHPSREKWQASVGRTSEMRSYYSYRKGMVVMGGLKTQLYLAQGSNVFGFRFCVLGWLCQRACEEGGLKAQLHLAQGNTLGNDDTPIPGTLKGQLHKMQASGSRFLLWQASPSSPSGRKRSYYGAPND